MSAVHVIIAAGGVGSRFAGEKKKQFLHLAGETILQRSVAVFLQHPSVKQVVVVLPDADLAQWKFTDARVHTVAGGATRAASVRQGFLHLRAAANEDCILVHDAARPLLRLDLVDRVIEAVHRAGAAVPVVEVTETLKQIADDRVIGTIDRNTVRLAQTPQGAKYHLLQKAFCNSDVDFSRVTDEAMLLEICGFPVVWVEGQSQNIKITTPHDLDLAEFFWSQRV